MNASPSLTASSQSDYELKCRLLEDMLHIIDMENRYFIFGTCFKTICSVYVVYDSFHQVISRQGINQLFTSSRFS